MADRDEEILELSARQKLAQRVCAIAILALGGLFFLLSGIVDAFPDIVSVLAATILLCFALIFLICAIIGKNPVSVWISVAFFVPFGIELLTHFDAVTYAQIYPLYIAIPFVASLFSGTIWRNIKPHLFAMILFGGMAVLFALQSSGVAGIIDGRNGWAFVLPLAGAHLIACLIWILVKLTRKS